MYVHVCMYALQLHTYVAESDIEDEFDNTSTPMHTYAITILPLAHKCTYIHHMEVNAQ